MLGFSILKLYRQTTSQQGKRLLPDTLPLGILVPLPYRSWIVPVEINMPRMMWELRQPTGQQSSPNVIATLWNAKTRPTFCQKLIKKTHFQNPTSSGLTTFERRARRAGVCEGTKIPRAELANHQFLLKRVARRRMI